MASVYEIVTERIIKELEKGIIPWEKPWFAMEGLDGAFNRTTKKPYSLLNQMLLGKPGEWASLKQWNKLGGKIRKGERASLVTFWKSYPKEITVTNEDGEEVKQVGSVWVLRYYNVFHIDQVEGVEPLNIEDEKEKLDIQPIEVAENLLNGYISHEGIKLCREKKSDKAYYSPTTDSIVLPTIKQFKTAEHFYDTAFHEMTHSTGHPNRLNRFTSENAHFGSEEYSKEELVAEIGSAVLANLVGTSTPKTERNNAAYIQSWLRALKNDTKMIVSAASKAEKAVEFIRNAAANAVEITDVEPETVEAVAEPAVEEKPTVETHEEIDASGIVAEKIAEFKAKVEAKRNRKNADALLA